jgi:hypothetical protein
MNAIIFGCLLLSSIVFVHQDIGYLVCTGFHDRQLLLWVCTPVNFALAL